MTKKQKNARSDRSYNVHDHRADELAFDVVERNDSVITLHAHVNSADVDPIVIVVTATDYIVNGTQFDTVAQTLDTLTSVHTN